MSQSNIEQKSPFVMEVQPGIYKWCACGKSLNQPYYEGTHKTL